MVRATRERMITFRVPAAMAQAISRLAAEAGCRTRSEWLRRLVDEASTAGAEAHCERPANDT